MVRTSCATRQPYQQVDQSTSICGHEPRLISNTYQIPPENLVTQGYGEQNLKVPTEGPSRENRRVAARRITPLLRGASAQ
jgi:hypothetical protein